MEANKLKSVAECKGRLKELVGDDGILQLAKDGICPHYVITNPLTKEETIWFIPSELNEWLDSNYVRYNEGYFTQKYEFITFNENEYRAYGEVPKELSKISNLYHLPIKDIKTPPGIYFLCKGNEIQYIGQSSNISQRVITHLTEGLKEFENVYFITCPINRLTEVETALIRYYNPPLNKTSNVAPKGKDVFIVNSLLKAETI